VRQSDARVHESDPAHPDARVATSGRAGCERRPDCAVLLVADPRADFVAAADYAIPDLHAGLSLVADAIVRVPATIASAFGEERSQRLVGSASV
jgi:hypothetical protein